MTGSQRSAEEIHTDTWVDNDGSAFLARDRYGEEEDVDTATPEETTSVEKSHTPHYSHRGGRSYPEDDTDPHWQLTDTTRLSPEQLASNSLARTELQIGFDVAESIRADRVAEGAKPVADALIRARREKRDRERAARGLPPIDHIDDETIETLKSLTLKSLK